MKSKCHNDAMETFKKLKKYNLNSLNAKDVDIKTAMSDADNYIKKFNDLNKTYTTNQMLENQKEFGFEEEKKSIKVVFR